LGRSFGDSAKADMMDGKCAEDGNLIEYKGAVSGPKVSNTCKKGKAMSV